jgi:anti-repressor protein|nr:MAG TPA: KilAC domain protein [Caudoviricetes sp.]
MEKELTTTTALQQVVYKTEKGTPVTDSVKVAEVFGKMHKNVLKSIRNILWSAQNLAHKTWFHQVTYIDAQGKTQPMFLMNRDGFSLLAMSLTGERALQFKVGFIQQFDMMEQALKEIAPAIPQTFAQALRLAAEQAETIEAQQKQLAEQAPKVNFAKALEIAGESILIGQLAKLMRQNGVDTGEIRLYQWMRDNGFLHKCGSEYNDPTQRALEMGLFEVRTGTRYHPHTGEPIQTRTTLVTIKGQQYFINKLVYKSQHP